MEREELFGEELEQILDLYPAGTPLHVVEVEEEPGDLPPLSDSSKAAFDDVPSEELPSRRAPDGLASLQVSESWKQPLLTDASRGDGVRSNL